MKRFVPLSSSWRQLALRFFCFTFFVIASTLAARAQAPQITTQPESLSVLSGQTANFVVEVIGAQPLRFQWQQNGTNFSAGTSQNLTIPDVQPRHYGDYALIVSNSLGVVTSKVAELRVDEHLTFRIVALMTNGVIATEGNTYIGDDKGGIAVSSNNVFVTGGSDGGDRARTGRFPIDTLTPGATLPTGFDTMTGNLRTETVYSLGNGNTPIQYLNFAGSHTTCNSLLEIDGNTGVLTGNRITLSTNIPLPSSQEGNIGLFAGYDRIVVHNGQRVYNIDLPSGQVTDLGAMASITHVYAENALVYWGMAEYWRGAIYIVYVQNSTTLVRTRVPDRQTTPLLSLSGFPQYFGSMASIAFSISRSRWYAHVEGTSFLRENADETVGSAKASFTQDPGYPTILNDLPNLVSYPSSNVTFSVNASGSPPLAYAWFFNGEPIQGANGPSLTLSNIDETDEGFYSVEVSNPVGSLSSRQAYLTIYSIPEIVSNPLSRSVFVGTNVTLSVTVNAAPPVSYQWRFNGAAIANATNRTLLLTNVQASADGLYYVEVVNRFGTVSSEEAELHVVQPVDDGTIFRIASLGSNGLRVVDTYFMTDFNFQYGPFAVGRENVFYSIWSDSYYMDAPNLSINRGVNAFYGAMLSNLRSEKVYALADDRLPFDFSGGTATELIELDPRNGTLTSIVIKLSTPIPVGPINSQAGFFSGYGRAVVLNGFRAYEIALPSGAVTDLGPMTTPFHAFSFSGAFWGVCERSGGINYLVYARDSRQIVRTRVPDGQEAIVATFANLSSYMSSMSVSIPRNRWYFQHLFSSQFTNGNSVMGYGPASFILSSGNQADHFAFDPFPPRQLVNQPFPITIRALTSSNRVATNFSGVVSLQGLATNGSVVSVAPTTLSNFVDGVWSGNVTVLQANPAMRLRAFDDDGNEGLTEVFAANPTNDIIVDLTDSPDPVVLGQLLTYTALITNTGPLIATGVTFTNTLPNTLQLVDYETSKGSCVNAGNLVRCAIGNIAVGEVIEVVVTARAAVLGSVTNTVRIGRTATDPSPANNSATETTQVQYPALRVGSITVVEGNSGTNEAAIPITLSAPWTNDVGMTFSTSGGSAVSIPPNNDFVSRFGALVFPAGTTTQLVMVPVRGDALFESNEVFYMNISSPTNAIIADSQGTCLILNDDDQPFVSIHDAGRTEADAGTANLLFQVRLSAPAGMPVTVRCGTADGTAIAGHDYAPRSQLLTFQANTSTLTQNVSVQIIGDTKIEPDESFRVAILAATNAIIARREAVGVITNNDGAMVLHTFAWSAIPAQVETNTPVSVTITAKDIFGDTVTNFANSVTLSGGIPLAQENGTLLEDADAVNWFTGSYTFGYYFTPETNITVTHVRAYYGTKVTLWSADGTVLATQPVPNYERVWINTPLDTPVTLAAGSSNLVTVYTDAGRTNYSTLTVPPTFAHGSFGWSAWTTGDAFPINAYTGERFLVDLVYTVGPAASMVNVAPTNSGSFVNGVWSGQLAILQPATNMQLYAEDAQRHVGASNPFRAGISGPRDDDNDGMWDDWEAVYLFNPTDPSDGDQDADGDGHNNRAEFQLGSDPLDARSALRIESVTVSDSQVTIRFYGVLPGNRYRLETRAGLGAGDWTPLGEVQIGDLPHGEFTEPLGGSGPRFYRIRFLQP